MPSINKPHLNGQNDDGNNERLLVRRVAADMFTRKLGDYRIRAKIFRDGVEKKKTAAFVE